MSDLHVIFNHGCTKRFTHAVWLPYRPSHDLEKVLREQGDRFTEWFVVEGKVTALPSNNEAHKFPDRSFAVYCDVAIATVLKFLYFEEIIGTYENPWHSLHEPHEHQIAVERIVGHLLSPDQIEQIKKVFARKRKT